MFGNSKKIQELEERIQRQEKALTLKNQFIALQENYISTVIEKAKLVQKELHHVKLSSVFVESFVFSQAKEVLNSHFYHCSVLENGQKIIVIANCGEGDSASVIIQTHLYHLLNQFILGQKNIEIENLFLTLNPLIQKFELPQLSIFKIEEKGNISFCGTEYLFIYQTENLVKKEKITSNIVHLQGVTDLYIFTSGILHQPNHDDESVIYSEDELMNFVQKNKNQSKKEQFIAWENELDEWMGCCGEQAENMLFVGLKL